MEGGNAMNPVSLVLDAVARWCERCSSNTTKQATKKDAYAGLKALVKKRFEKKPQAEMSLVEYEKDTDTWEKPRQKLLVKTGADQDKAIIRQAQRVLKLGNRQQASQGKYNVQIGEGKGTVIGVLAQVTQTSGEP
jgi:hypothetical protein